MSWEELLSIRELNRIEVQEDEEAPPAACPTDGFPLEVGPNGELHCPFGGEIFDQ